MKKFATLISLSPGLVDTPIHDWMTPDRKVEFFKQMGGELPVGRVGQPKDIAEAISYFIKNGFTRGSILDVDGGGRLH